MNKKDEIDGPGVYCLKVALKGIRPAIWRRFKVSGDIALDKLHQVIQLVMGWTDSHLHTFEIRDDVYSSPDPEGEDELRFKNENGVRLCDVVLDVSETFL